MEKFFKLKENNTDAKTEFIAGLTTFMTMAYILIVNPSILSARSCIYSNGFISSNSNFNNGTLC